MNDRVIMISGPNLVKFERIEQGIPDIPQINFMVREEGEKL